MKHLFVLSICSLVGVVSCSESSPQAETTPTNTADGGGMPAQNSPDASPPPAKGGTCSPETTAAFCSNFSRQCDNYSGFDNCSLPRNENCGTCPTTSACINGGCVVLPTPTPNCTPESDSDFCTQYSKTCGPYKNIDNCGMVRSAASCGNCASPSTCTDNNICVAPPPPNCVAESDQAFCSRNSFNCGSHTTVDNCGHNRTVASCGTLLFNSGSGLNAFGGIPAEIANGSFHVEAWVNPSKSQGTVYGDVFNMGQYNPNGPYWNYSTNIFDLSIQNGFLSSASQSTITIPAGEWTFVFAEGDTVGKIVNGIVYRYNVRIDTSYGNPLTGQALILGQGFTGQMNNIRIWSKSRTDAEMLNHYHDCLSVPQPGLVRQWCFPEGSGATTNDSVSGNPTLLNGATWDTGNCQNN